MQIIKLDKSTQAIKAVTGQKCKVRYGTGSQFNRLSPSVQPNYISDLHFDRPTFLGRQQAK